MTIPIRLDVAHPNDDPLDRLIARKRARETEAAAITAPVVASAPAVVPAVRPDVSRALPTNRPNARGDFQAATANPGEQASFIGRGIAANALNAAQAIPGMEAIEAGAGALGSRFTDTPLSYRESLATLRGETERIPAAARLAEQAAFGGRYFPQALRGMSPAKAGMLIGGSGQALAADPDQSLAERGLRTAAGTVAGGVTGKLLDMGTTAVRAAAAKGATRNILDRQAERAASAKRLYDAALAEGRANEVTPQIREFLAEEEIAKRVADLQKLDEFKNLAPESPEMLDALYKRLSDEAKTAAKALAVADPSKPNLGRFYERGIRGLKDRLLNVVSTPGVKPPLTMEIPGETTVLPTRPLVGPESAREHLRQRAEAAAGSLTSPVNRQTSVSAAVDRVLARTAAKNEVAITTPTMRVQTAPAESMPAMMPKYREAVEDFARRTAEINAVGKGMTVSQASTSAKRPTFKQITSKEPKTPETFAQWVSGATPGERAAASEGILGDIANATGEKSWTFAPFRRAASTGAALLRSADTPTQKLINSGQITGLNAANALVSDHSTIYLSPQALDPEHVTRRVKAASNRP